jgi:RNA polymerase sigma-70 factor (ECF subfamily)
MAEYPHVVTPPVEGLLPRIAAGDPDAFAALFRAHSGDVFRFALHMTGSRALADDVTQDVFLAVMRDAGRYVPGLSSEGAWLRGIARNHVRRRLDGERATVMLPDDAEDACPVAKDCAPLAAMVKEEQLDALRRAVSSLPIRYREVIVLCDLQELSYADAAATLSCVIGTVRSRLSRGRALLAAKLRVAEEPNAAVRAVERAEASVEGGEKSVESGKKAEARWAI